MPLETKDPNPTGNHLLQYVRNALIQVEQEAKAERRKRQIAARNRRKLSTRRVDGSQQREVA